MPRISYSLKIFFFTAFLGYKKLKTKNPRTSIQQTRINDQAAPGVDFGVSCAAIFASTSLINVRVNRPIVLSSNE